MRGEITEYDVKVLELAALKGVFTDVVEDQVSYVNAPLLAAERGTAVRLVTEPESPDHRNLITIRGTLADGSQVSVSGTLVGIAPAASGWSRSTASTSTSSPPTTWRSSPTRTARAWSAPSAGSSATAGVNIAGMQVARDAKGGQALVALSVDSAIPAEALAEIERGHRRDRVGRPSPESDAGVAACPVSVSLVRPRTAGDRSASWTGAVAECASRLAARLDPPEPPRPVTCCGRRCRSGPALAAPRAGAQAGLAAGPPGGRAPAAGP